LFIVGAAADQVTAQSHDSIEELIKFFYKDPRPARLVGALERYETAAPPGKWDPFPPVVGFFAVAFRAYPDKIETFIPVHLSPKMADTIASALQLAGNQPMLTKLQPRLAAAGSDPMLKAELAGLPNRIEDIRIQIPTHLDILWGASFASGDGKYASMILDFLRR
jgi:hypothetical protein